MPNYSETKERRQYTEEEKMKIIEEAETEGIHEVLHKYKIAHSVYYRWRRQQKLKKLGKEDVKYTEMEIDTFVEENDRLKMIVANQLLEIERLKELIYKKRK